MPAQPPSTWMLYILKTPVALCYALDSTASPTREFPVSEVLAADTISDTALPRQVYQIPEGTTRQLFVTIWEES